MITVYDVPAELLIKEIARDLKENRKLQQPLFVGYSKSGAHRERAPQNPDWWYVRCASVLRRVLVDGAHGTGSLRTYYGGRKSRGSKPHRFRKASGKVIRSCLQALEKQGLLEKAKKGRVVSKEGQKYLNDFAKKVKLVEEEEKKKVEERRKEREKAIKEKMKKGIAEKPAAEKKKKKKGKEDEDPTKIKLKKTDMARH